MKRILFAFTMLITGWQFAYAQIPITGKVLEADKHTPLPSIKVQNIRTHNNTMTNANGVFMIQAKAGDILILEGFSFHTDTVAVTNARYMEINMKLSSNPLREVKIQNTTTKLGSLKDPSLTNKAVTYQRNSVGDVVGGVTLNFGYGKSSKEKQQERLAKDTLATQAIDRAFSPANLSKYVPLKGLELKQFSTLYRPTIEQYKAPNFDMAFYVNESYKKFGQLTPDERNLPALKADSVKEQKPAN